ncbi:MAG: polysaccharide deacetylase family protein [Thermodesulfobacteriota bacterium]
MISSLYKKLPGDTKQQLQTAIEKGLANGQGEAQIFFRADDIGVPSRQFSQLIQLFQQHKIPLCLAVVPAWLTHSRFETLSELSGKDSSLWCWHQHGWRHRNHEQVGKKQEFGPGRPPEEQLADLQKGKDRLQLIMGDTFAPFFTPPWNRCSLETLQGLKNLKFRAVSRSLNATPPAPTNLPDLQVNIDLHTRKEVDPTACLTDLLTELEQGIASSTGGVMIHHQRMNQSAVEFLGLLLDLVANNRHIHLVRFQDLC